MSHTVYPNYTDIIQNSEALRSWKENLTSEPYRSYLYAYPHKTSYRELERKLPLSELWSQELADTLFLYMHIPFCGARCGFCNLFTLPDKRADVHTNYVDALERQAAQWAPLIPNKPVARFAIGGGTPTLLEPTQLDRLFHIAQHVMGMNPNQASISVETSPETITTERLDILKSRQVDRVSMGIQSFVEFEADAIYRPQKPQEVERALRQLKLYQFPILNLDLIYGLPGQTLDSWIYSLDKALSYDPEELFIYPLYTREHTIVKPEQIRQSGEDQRLSFYRVARDRLRAHGYTQYSMRRFAKADAMSEKSLLPYGCQEEGMIGLGCGARSYTRTVHYSSRYSVGRSATASIIADYVASADYTHADYGIVLSKDDQQRRFILKALLHTEGLALSSYAERFTSSALVDYPELNLLVHTDLAAIEHEVLRLTDEGLMYSDSIGDWFISPEIRARMESCVLL
ncbi:STM4012 family radical SAM protein [Paenibacillus sp. UMB4589-SE434]|uniref:STM4012 family radical SAM protein n=1 Tax=Paenibacillus sp. UMB4589-SE434 TaxID=3046314 RepID=UPI00254E627C|nr:STM4012 family radical SAM protein [Paenibacillus sp. UMB4589-SE434]MDK8180079.1 STM4012 family radical SAM protein [Paenibacillus sp. UMB4589-SE434]